MKTLASALIATGFFFLIALPCATTAETASNGISSLPKPWIIAHRGGPLLWPEETMEAYEASTAAGNHFVEVDCWLLNRDEAIGIMHDSALARTTTSQKYVTQLGSQDWGALKIDGQRLLGPKWGQYHAPFLSEIIVRFGNRKVMFLEPKDGRSGPAIVEKLKTSHISNDHVVINSFIEGDLRAAIRAGYKTCLNLNDMSHTPESLKKAGYWSVLCPGIFTEAYVTALKKAGLVVIAGPVNRHYQRDRFLSWGVEGIYTDDPLYQALDAKYRRSSDPFAEQRYAAGMLEAQPGGRGYFALPNKWGIDASTENVYKGCLQGWMCPIGGKAVAQNWSMELSITFASRFQDGRWASVAILENDAPLNSDERPTIGLRGYNILFENTGGISVQRYDGRPATPPIPLGRSGALPIRIGDTVRYRINITTDSIEVERLGTDVRLIVQDRQYRGAYVTFGAKGQRAEFSEIQVATQ